MPSFLEIPPEILLYIFTFLDVPELEALTKASKTLGALTTDPVLHHYRLCVVSPSRVNHSLFSKGPHGHALRPSVGDLVHRGVIRGLGIERRWRTGNYFYSLNSIVQYENSLALSRRQAGHILSMLLRRRIQLLEPSSTPSNNEMTRCGGISRKQANPLLLLASSNVNVVPDIESCSPYIARSLLPTVRKLKWSIQRDTFARLIKAQFYKNGGKAGFEKWLFEGRGREVVREGEKLRLAICPDIRQRVVFFEALARV